eukprot:14752422-Heterocapsa_arctica.AAC.1
MVLLSCHRAQASTHHSKVKTTTGLNIFKWASTTSTSSHGCARRSPPTSHAASPSCSTEGLFSPIHICQTWNAPEGLHGRAGAIR